MNYAHTKYQVNENITLTQKEKDIFSHFTNFVAEKKIPTVIRVAGGWVRDKVLQKRILD